MAIRSGPVQDRGAPRSGFTLLEIVVALGVASVAATIAVSFLITSLTFADTSREHKVAASIAEGELHRLIHTPAAFVWPAPASMEAGKALPVTLRGSDSMAQPSDMPDAKPLMDRRAGAREVNFNSQFTWSSYATLPADPNAPYLEVSVVVNWATSEETPRPQSLTLTSAIPKARVEGLQ